MGKKQKNKTSPAPEHSFVEIPAQFIGANIKIHKTTLPLGQVSADIMNITTEKMHDLEAASDVYAKFAFGRFMHPATKHDAAFVKEIQDKLNGVLEILLDISPYCYMEMDREYVTNCMTIWYETEPETFFNFYTRGTPQNIAFSTFVNSVMDASHNLFVFKAKIGAFTQVYTDPLTKRGAAEYAHAMFKFLADGEKMDSWDEVLKGRDVFKLTQTRRAMVDYVPMRNPDNPDEFIIAESMLFSNIGEFLHMDLFRALMHGNIPRQCANCGKYFLLTNGFNTKYCSNIAPGETSKTCHHVGAYKKQAEKVEASPTQKAYRTVYNRLKTRKGRGKISAAEWNEAVAKAQDLKLQAEQGKITEQELLRIYDEQF